MLPPTGAIGEASRAVCATTESTNWGKLRPIRRVSDEVEHEVDDLLARDREQRRLGSGIDGYDSHEAYKVSVGRRARPGAPSHGRQSQR